MQNKIKLAETETELVNGLFKPGGTADGHIIKRTAHSLKIFYLGQEHTINRFGVCSTLSLKTGFRIAEDYCKDWTHDSRKDRVYRFK